MADWVKGRQTLRRAALQLSRSTMPLHNTFRPILAEVVEPTELETMVQWCGFTNLAQARRSDNSNLPAVVALVTTHPTRL